MPDVARSLAIAVLLIGNVAVYSHTVLAILAVGR